MTSKFNDIMELLRRYNNGEINLTDEEAKKLSEIAFKLRQDFKVKSKPLQKGLFDLVDSATLGLVPNKWRPKSIGERLHGESSVDRWAGNIGGLAGYAVPGFGAYKALTTPGLVAKASAKVGQGTKYGKNAIQAFKERENVKRAVQNARDMYKGVTGYDWKGAGNRIKSAGGRMRDWWRNDPQLSLFE